MINWLCDAAILWCCMILWCCYAMVLQSYVFVMLWFCDFVVLWCWDAILLWCCYAVMLYCYNVAMLWWFCDFVILWRCDVIYVWISMYMQKIAAFTTTIFYVFFLAVCTSEHIIGRNWKWATMYLFIVRC